MIFRNYCLLQAGFFPPGGKLLRTMLLVGQTHSVCIVGTPSGKIQDSIGVI